jgi:hypothetical protein
MKKEWFENFLNNLKKTKTLLINNSNNDKIPRYVPTLQFLQKYTNMIFKDNSDSTKLNPYLVNSNKQEYRILKLIEFLSKSNLSYQKNNQSMNLEEETTSQVIQVNNIIKDSFELTTASYLLEWLHSVFSVEDLTERIKPKTMHSFSETARQENNFQIYPDRFNDRTNNLHPEDQESYSKVLRLVLNNIRAGKLNEAQKISEYYDNSFLSAMLDGGLPFNDLLYDDLNSLARIDFDLFPPFMRNKDFYTLKEAVEKYQHSGNKDEIRRLHDSCFGNLYWREWLLTSYYQIEFENHEKNNEIKLIQSYISGNVKFVESNSVNIYEHLYFGFLNYLNTSVIEEFNKINENQIETRFKTKSILNVIKSLRESESYKSEIHNVYNYNLEPIVRNRTRFD